MLTTKVLLCNTRPALQQSLRKWGQECCVTPKTRACIYDSSVQDPHWVSRRSGVHHSLTATEAVPDLHQDMQTLFQRRVYTGWDRERIKAITLILVYSDEECPEAWVDEFILEDASNLFQDEGFHFSDILQHLFTATLPPYLTLNFDVLQ